MCDWDWPDLRTPTLEILLSFYNQDFEQEPAHLLDNVTQALEILHFWRVHGKPDIPLTGKNLLNFLIDVVI